MKHPSLLIQAALCMALVSCASSPPAPQASTLPTSEAPISHRNGQLDLALTSGNYSCELGKSVKVEREYREQVNYRIQLGWNGRSYQLERDNSFSGLPRFKDKAGKMVWVDLPWKGLLLDGKTSKPLANDCRSPGSAASPAA